MHYKKASIEDIETIRAIANESWREAYKEILSAEQIDYMLEKMYSHSALEEHLNHPNIHYFLLKDPEPLGFIGFETNAEPGVLKLHRIYMLPGAKGRGYGKSGISFLKEFAKKTGAITIKLNVNKQNKAQDFYKSQGFVLDSEEVIDIGEGYVMDDYNMKFEL